MGFRTTIFDSFITFRHSKKIQKETYSKISLNSDEEWERYETPKLPCLNSSDKVTCKSKFQEI